MTTYLRDSEGKFIPSTQRPDGTWRKARRVKDGYVPQEEVPLYESKGKQFAKKPTLPVGLSPLIAQAAREKREKQERQQLKQQNKQAATNKTAGLIPIDKVINATEGGSCGGGGVGDSEKKKSKSNIPSSSTTDSTKTSRKDENQIKELCADVTLLSTVDSAGPEDEDIAKQLRKLRKKIRAIETIEERLKSGELKNPEQDQLEKVARKLSILEQIKQLEKHQQ